MTWRQITCEAADALRSNPLHVPLRSKTDISGQFGEPEIFTEWGLEDETPVMREHRYPGPDNTRPDAKPCEHYQFDPGEAPAAVENPDGKPVLVMGRPEPVDIAGTLVPIENIAKTEVTKWFCRDSNGAETDMNNEEYARQHCAVSGHTLIRKTITTSVESVTVR